MPNLSETTIQKMRAVIRAVLAEPEFYDQQWFPQMFDCGATCCAAGWTVWLEDPVLYEQLAISGIRHWPERARNALGLPEFIPGANFSVDRQLFLYADYWPEEFAQQYRMAETYGGKAQAMANRWNHFIKTDGVE